MPKKRILPGKSERVPLYFIVRIHGSMFGLSPEFIKGALYGFLGVYKIVLIVFIFVPWIALLLMP